MATETEQKARELQGARNTKILSDIIPQTIVSESKPSAFPSALRSKRSAVQTLSAEDRKTEAVTNHLCGKCGRTEMFFTTVQLRSADEGSTVFYRCVCGYKYAFAKKKLQTLNYLNRDANNRNQGNLEQLGNIDRCG